MPPVSASKDSSQDFADIVGPPRGQGGAAALPDREVAGLVKGPLEMAQPVWRRRGCSAIRDRRLHSCAPVAWGPYAAHMHVFPGAGRNLPRVAGLGRGHSATPCRGCAALGSAGPVLHRSRAHPIEDGRKIWKAPKLTVGNLVLDSLADAEVVEADRFDPWSAVAEHRPLGEIMRARKAAYFPSYRNRT